MKDLANKSMNTCSSMGLELGGERMYGNGYVIERHGPRPSYEKCDELNDAAGIDKEDWKNLRYPSTGMDPDRYVLLEDGRVFTDPQDGGDRTLVEASDVVAEVKRQHEEDRAIVRARLCLADDLAKEWGGSQMAFTLFQTAIWYNQGDPGEGSVKENDVRFWTVGRNSSHNFYMGMKKVGENVEFFRASFEPGYPDDWRQSPVTEFAGYYGHA